MLDQYIQHLMLLLCAIFFDRDAGGLLSVLKEWGISSSMATRDDILSLLRRNSLTITEMSERLGITRNAVIVPLKQLQAAGLVEGMAATQNRVGKPAMTYSAVPGREDVASSAYPAFSELLVAAISQHLNVRQTGQLMAQVGTRMAQQLNTGELADFPQRLRAATDLVDSLGAETVVTTAGEETLIRSYSCPLARAVRQNGCVCTAVATFFSHVTGKDVVEQCSRGQRLVCQFAIRHASMETGAGG